MRKGLGLGVEGGGFGNGRGSRTAVVVGLRAKKRTGFPSLDILAVPIDVTKSVGFFL